MTATFWLSAALLVYAYAGYPLLALALGVCRRRRVRRAACEPSVTLLIAARNEAACIGRTLANKLALDYPPGKLQIIVVSDASGDGTDAIVRAVGGDRVRLLRLEERRGKTAALNLAARHATGDVLVFSDANSMYAPDALRMLLRNFSDPEVGYVTGRLQYASAGTSAVAAGCGAYMEYEHRLRIVETLAGSIVGVNGGIDAVRRALYVTMTDDQLPDFVLPLAVVRAGYRVVYEPEAILSEEALTTSRGEYRMRVRVSLRALWTLSDMRALFDVRRYGWFSLQLASHKALRYAAFAALPVVYGAAFALRDAGMLYAASFGALSLVFALALCGAVLERSGRTRWFLTIPYYFVLINAAAASAMFQFCRGRRQSVWVPRLG